MELSRSGRVWNLAAAARVSRIRAVCGILRKTYGLPRFGNPSDPLDDLIYVMISTRTTMAVTETVFSRLKKGFRSWDDVLRLPISRLRRILKPAGLSVRKSAQIRATLRTIKGRFGLCDLRPLSMEADAAVEEFLVSLPGVSQKVAKCVMMYAMQRQVLPVDVHVYRVSQRLGWVNRKRADQCHEELEGLVPPILRHGYHVACVAHGRTVCWAEPRCGECPIRRLCDFYKRQHGSQKTHSR